MTEMTAQATAKPLIRPAEPEDSEVLTQIAFASKGYWNYPEAYYELWRDELTVTPEYIAKNRVFVAEAGMAPGGFAAVLQVEKAFRVGPVFIEAGYWLDHLFVSPASIGQGIGSALLEHVRKTCRDRGIAGLSLFADPHAAGFYEKAGAVFLKEVPSSIPGRTLPLYRLPIP